MNKTHLEQCPNKGEIKVGSEIQQSKIAGFLQENIKYPIIKQLTNDLFTVAIEEGFFVAPASTRYHGNHANGLAEHTLHTMVRCAQQADVFKEYFTPIEKEWLIFAAFAHDIGKAGINGKSFYMPSLNKTGGYNKKAFDVNSKELCGYEHATLSAYHVNRLKNSNEIPLDVMQAIHYHNGLYDAAGKAVSGKEGKYMIVLHFVDMMASRVIEVGEEE